MAESGQVLAVSSGRPRQPPGPGLTQFRPVLQTSRLPHFQTVRSGRSPARRSGPASGSSRRPAGQSAGFMNVGNFHGRTVFPSAGTGEKGQEEAESRGLSASVQGTNCHPCLLVRGPRAAADSWQPVGGRCPEVGTWLAGRRALCTGALRTKHIPRAVCKRQVGNTITPTTRTRCCCLPDSGSLPAGPWPCCSQPRCLMPHQPRHCPA